MYRPLTKPPVSVTAGPAAGILLLNMTMTTTAARVSIVMGTTAVDYVRMDQQRASDLVVGTQQEIMVYIERQGTNLIL